MANQIAHRTLADVARALFMLCFIVSSGLVVNLLQLIVYCCRPFALNWARDVNAHLVDLHWGLLIYLFAVWGGVNLRMFGTEIPAQSSCIGHMNHRSDVDWVLGFSYAYSRNCLGRMKIVMKEDFKLVPVLGWTMMMSEFVFAKRDWQHDRVLFQNALETLKKFPNPMWMVIFPEGTRCTPSKLEKSIAYSKAHNLPVFNHVLLPRTKGWITIMQSMRDKLGHMIDGTVAFPEREPSVMDLFCGTANVEAFLHLEWLDLTTLPRDEEGLEKWLYESWAKKEEEVAYVDKHKQMPPHIKELHHHVGHETKPLFRAWLCVLSLIYLGFFMLLPAEILLETVAVVVLLACAVVVGVYIVLMQRQTKRHSKRHD